MFHNDDEITRIGKGLSDQSLPKSDWTHAAHIAAAVWLLDRQGDRAFHLMPGLIRRYNLATGVPNTDLSGYHHTITLASLKAISGLRLKGSLCERTNTLLAMGYARPGWLLSHYTKDRLFSVRARREWIDPDLLPLPQDVG